MLFAYRQNAVFQEPMCSNSVEVTKYHGTLQCQLQTSRKIEMTVR